MIAVIESYRAGLFGRKHLLNNLGAGLVVGLVALPLAMAFAIASGAKPEQGLYTAIVAGFLTSTLGGSRLQISGPTGAFIASLSGITAVHGIAGLQLATIMAGFILLAMGLLRVGAIIKYIPRPVIIGFTSGIATIIWVGQWKDFFGLKPAASSLLFHEKLLALLQALPHLDWATTSVACQTLLVLIFAPRFLPKIPAPLLAIIYATVVQIGMFDQVATIGSAFGGIPQSLPSWQWPTVSLQKILELAGPAFAIAMLGAIESLLSAVVADGMAGTKHDSNQELVGQGIANIAAPLFGGFAATGAIARTATNIRHGATSPLSGIVHCAVLLLVMLVFAPWAKHLPLCALSAILFVVAYRMGEWHHFIHLFKTAPKSDVAIMLTTFGLTVFSDLVLAVNAGVMLAALLFMKRMGDAVTVEDTTQDLEDLGSTPLPPNTMIYRINGPFFFGAAERLQDLLQAINDKPLACLILDMRQVPFADATGVAVLGDLIGQFHQRDTRVILCGGGKQLMANLDKAHLLTKLGLNNIVSDVKNLGDALAS
ncbi:MAG: SulP family inorganic anion transporter [Holosporaceae bacterium]